MLLHMPESQSSAASSPRPSVPASSASPPSTAPPQVACRVRGTRQLIHRDPYAIGVRRGDPGTLADHEAGGPPSQTGVGPSWSPSGRFGLAWPGWEEWAT